ncbi:MAG: hypothetical protein AB1705_04720 [Verrucomicrobiota bacterium]
MNRGVFTGLGLVGFVFPARESHTPAVGRRAAIRLLLLLPLLALVFTGCALKDAKDDAQAVVTSYFQSMATANYDAAMINYDPEFFKKSSREAWKKFLTKNASKLGAYKKHTINGWRIFRRADAPKASFVELQCKSVYANNTALEKFTLCRQPGDTEFRIIAHTIDSVALRSD